MDSQTLQMLMSYIQSNPQMYNAVRDILTSLLGNNPNNLNPMGMVGGNSFAFNTYQQIAQQRQMAMMGPALTDIRQTMNNAMVSSFLQFTEGRTPTAAEIAGAKIPQMIANYALTDTWAPGAMAMGSAFFNRRNAWSPLGGGPQESLYEYGKTVQDAMRTTMESARNGKYFGMSINDAGSLAGELVKTGRYDKDKNRVESLNADMTRYSESISLLKDVIDGPLDKLLNSFEALTGSRLGAMDPGRVSMIATAMRNTMTGGMTAQGIAQLAAQQYMRIAPLGGTQAQATSMALMTGSTLNQGISIEGASVNGMADVMGNLNAQLTSDSTYRTVTTAYTHWLVHNNKQSSQESWAEFKNSEMKGGANMYSSAQAYINRNPGAGAYFASSMVDRNMTNPAMMANMTSDRLLGDWRSQAKSLNKMAKDAGGKGVNFDNMFDAPEKVAAQLRSSGVAESEIARIMLQYDAAVRGVTRTNNVADGAQVLRNVYGANAEINREAYEPGLRRMQGTANAGWEGLSQYLMRDKEGGVTIAGLMRSVLGLESNIAGFGKTGPVTKESIEKAFGKNAAALIPGIVSATGIGQMVQLGVTTGKANDLAVRTKLSNAVKNGKIDQDLIKELKETVILSQDVYDQIEYANANPDINGQADYTKVYDKTIVSSWANAKKEAVKSGLEGGAANAYANELSAAKLTVAGLRQKTMNNEYVSPDEMKKAVDKGWESVKTKLGPQTDERLKELEADFRRSASAGNMGNIEEMVHQLVVGLGTIISNWGGPPPKTNNQPG